MPDPQPVASGDGITDGLSLYPGGDNPFAAVASATPAGGSTPGGRAIDPVAWPGWTAGDFVNGRGVLGVKGPQPDPALAAQAGADIDAYVNRGVAQRLRAASPLPPANSSAGATSSGASDGFLAPPNAATPSGIQIWNGFRKGDHDEFANQFNGLAQAANALTTDPIGVAKHFLGFQSPPGQLQALWQVGQQVYQGTRELGREYQAAAHDGTLPYFASSVIGHLAVRGSEALTTGGVAGALGAAPEASVLDEGVYEFPDQFNDEIPYVGQSNKTLRRLREHALEGRHIPGTETVTPVPGGKTVREIAEHNRIQQLTGGQKAKNSPLVSNKRDPIGSVRRSLFGLPDPWD